MTKVLSIVPYKVLPAIMGGQSGIAMFNKHIADYVNLTCLTTKSNDVSYVNNYVINNILPDGKSKYINPFLFFTVIKHIKQNKITHVIFEHPYLGWLVVLIKLFTSVKIIIHSHNIEAQRFKTTKKWWWFILAFYEKITHQTAHHNFFIHEDDKLFAIKYYGLKLDKCTTITYGISWNKAPNNDEKIQAKNAVCMKHNIPQHHKIFLFNGTLNYTPNLNALKNILHNLSPLLQQQIKDYTIVICGSKLPADLNNLLDYKNQNIIYAGFVDDIKQYFLAANVFINPVVDGGGIKTKIVEALGYDLSLVTTKSGAIGVPENITKNKMIVVANNDWKSFANALETIDIDVSISQDYFNHFYWGNIAEKGATVISNL